MSAAIASARHGARTVLIQDRPVLGGNSSSEVRVTPHGAAAFHGYARETGIISEALVQDRAVNHAKIEENGWTNSVWDLLLYDMCVRTDGLTLHLNTTVQDVQTEDGAIRSVTAHTLGAELVRTIRSSVFIDCSGDGTVGALAGNEWRMGQEAQAEFDEPHAPEGADDSTMGSSLHFKTVDIGRPVEFTAPEWAVRYDDPEFFPRGGRSIPTLASGYWWIEIGTPWNTLYENEEVRHELTRHVLGIWDFLKNRHPHWSKLAGNIALDWVGQVPGKRESRRLIGREFLTENDLIENRVFSDEVAFGGWYVDLHTIGGLFAEVAEPVTTRLFEDLNAVSSEKKYVGPFGIPLGALTSKNLSNLLFAGRNISATHAALGSTRVMGTAAVMGQAAGTAAALVCREDHPTDSFANRIGDIQQALIRDGAFLPHVLNTDPDDLALTANVSASSEYLSSGAGPDSADNMADIDHWRGHPVYPDHGMLRKRSAQWVAVDSVSGVRELSVCLWNHSSEAETVSVALYEVDHIWEYRTDPSVPIREVEVEVPVGGPHWIGIPVGIEASELTRSFVRIDIDRNDNVEWVISPRVLPGQIAAFEHAPGRYRRYGGGATLSYRIEPAQHAYAPTMVASGHTRPYHATNLWRSDESLESPQWLQLEWQEAVELRQIQVTFAGHLLREYHAYPALGADPETVREYAIETWQDEQWVERARVTNNTAQRVVHELPGLATQKVRVVVYRTNGAPAAGVFEVRCYSAPKCVAPSFRGTEVVEIASA